MPSIAERLRRNPKLPLSVKQFRAVLEFTTALEDEMNRKDVSQSALAERLEKTRSWISKVFRRKPNLTFFTAVELADALDMDVHFEALPRHAASFTAFNATLKMTNLSAANTPSEMLPSSAPLSEPEAIRA